MRIVHVLGYFQPEFGYEEYYTARRQAIMGHEVHVVASDRYFPFRDLKGLLKGAGAEDTSRMRPVGREVVDGFTIHRLGCSAEMFYDLIFVRDLRRLLKDLRPDVVHAHEPKQGTPALAARYLDLGYTLVVDQHGYAPSYAPEGTTLDLAVRTEYSLVRRPLVNYAFGRAHAIVAVTEMSKRFLVDYHGIDPSRIEVLTLGVETDFFHRRPKARRRIRGERGLEEGDVLVVTAGRLDRAKGIERFLDALERAGGGDGPRWYLLVIGSGDNDYLMDLKRKAGDVGGRGEVEFMPFQAKERLPHYFSAADIGVWGKAAITILEAMACGLPVVVPGDETAAHLVSYGNGYGFTPAASREEQIEEMAEGLGRLISDPELRVRMGKRSLGAVKRKYDYRVRTERLMEIYAEARRRAGKQVED